MNNVLYSICKLRNHFMNSSETQNGLLQFMSGNSLETIPTGSICDGLGNQFNIEKLTDTRLKITQIVKSNQQDIVEVFNGTVNEWSDIINDYTGGVGGVATEALNRVHFSNFLLETSRGEQTNELFATILDKFTTNSRAKATDLCNIIDASKLSTLDISQLKTAIAAAADDEGYVSGYSILSLLRNLTGDSKEQLNAGKISMDDTKIFYLSNFLSSAFATIASTLVTIIGMLLSAVNAILGIIISAIGFIFNIIGQVLNNIGDDAKIQVSNPLSFVPWFDGPAIAKVLNFNSHSIDCASFLSYDEVKVKEEGPFSTCLWKTNDHSVAINRFLGLNAHLDRFAEWMFGKIQCNVKYNQGVGNADVNYEISVNRSEETSNPFDIPDSVYLTEEERMDILKLTPSQINDYIYSTYLVWCAYAVYCSLVYSNFGSNDILYCKVVRGTDQPSATYEMLKYAGEYKKHFAKRVLGMAVLAKWHVDHGNYLANGADVDLTELIIDDFNQFSDYASFEDLTGKISDQEFMERHTASNLRVDFWGYPVDECYYDPIACYTHVDTYFRVFEWANSNGEDNILSNIPTDRMFKFAKYDKNKVIAAMVIIGAITTVVLIAGGIAIKKFKKMKFRRQYDRKIELQGLKEDYDDDPTDENFKKLYKAQKSYNFKAKLFGWDSYDAGNDWFEATGEEITSSDTDASVDLSSIISLIR